MSKYLQAGFIMKHNLKNQKTVFDVVRYFH